MVQPEKYEVRLNAERDQLIWFNWHLRLLGWICRARILLKPEGMASEVALPWIVVRRRRCTGSSDICAEDANGRTAPGPAVPPVPEAGRPGGGPLDCTGLQPSTGRRPLDSAAAGQGGTIGAGAVRCPIAKLHLNQRNLAQTLAEAGSGAFPR